MSFIYALQATWNNVLTTYNGIEIDVSDGAGGAPVAAAGSRILNLLNNTVSVFSVDKNGVLIGGVGTTGIQATYQTTSGVGTTDAFAWKGGNNGASTFATLTNNAAGRGNYNVTGWIAATLVDPVGAVRGDICAARNDTTGVYMLGYDGTTYFLRAATDVSVQGATTFTLGATMLKIAQAPLAIGTGVKTVSNAADGSTNFGHYMSINMNGTTYYFPCSSVAPT